MSKIDKTGWSRWSTYDPTWDPDNWTEEDAARVKKLIDELFGDDEEEERD